MHWSSSLSLAQMLDDGSSNNIHCVYCISTMKYAKYTFLMNDKIIFSDIKCNVKLLIRTLSVKFYTH